MTGTVLKPTNVDYLDDLFAWPTIRPVPARALANVPQNDLSLWCLKRAIYQLPTLELIEFLAHQLGDPQSALEIGAGAGQIGRPLVLRMSDNKMQDWAQIKTHYRGLGQPTIRYGQDVELLTGQSAVSRYKPRAVLGCWITEKFKPGYQSGNPYGMDEDWLLSRPFLKTYVLVGNLNVHADKQILRLYAHQEYAFDWLFSRSMNKANNRIWVFTRPNRS